MVRNSGRAGDSFLRHEGYKSNLFSTFQEAPCFAAIFSFTILSYFARATVTGALPSSYSGLLSQTIHLPPSVVNHWR